MNPGLGGRFMKKMGSKKDMEAMEKKDSMKSMNKKKMMDKDASEKMFMDACKKSGMG